MSAQVYFHPGYWGNGQPVKHLRDALAQTLSTEAQWYCHQGPELAARYWASFGDLELAWLHAQADDCVTAHNQRVAAGRRHYRHAGRHLSRPALQPPQVARLLTDYNKLVRLRHPQVLGSQSGTKFDGAWPLVQQAFTAGDAQTLHGLAAATPWPVTEPLVSVDEKRRLQTTLAQAQDRLECMRKHFPFNLQDKLADSGWIASQRARMRSQLEAMPFAGAQQARVAVS